MNDRLRPARVLARNDETPEIAAFEIADIDGGCLPPFEPGAHIDVEPAPGFVRPYSLSRLPDARGAYRIGVLKDPSSRGGSLAMHALSPGDTIRISDPRNHFAMVEDAPFTLLFAGGIGVTPLLAMAERLSGAGADFALHYCVRSLAHAAFREDLAIHSGRVFLHRDDGASPQKLDIDAVLSAHSDAHLYVCGPSGFMGWIERAARRAGVDPSRVHREYFGADPSAPIDPGGPFRVKLARSGRVVDVAAGQTILSALCEQGVIIPKSCEAGVCGTCLTGVLAGEPDHRDYYLDNAEKAAGDRIIPCCSRSKSREMTLDI
jgi:vanillate O-demethylase ferredoxin subunit